MEWSDLSLLKTPKEAKRLEFWIHRHSVLGMLEHVRFVVAVLTRRFCSRAVVELENLALRHQLHVLRRQRPGRLRLLTIDRLLWVWLYRLWPRCLGTMVLVKPGPPSFNGTVKAFACFGVGVRDRDGRQWTGKFAS